MGRRVGCCEPLSRIVELGPKAKPMTELEFPANTRRKFDGCYVGPRGSPRQKRYIMNPWVGQFFMTQRGQFRMAFDKRAAARDAPFRRARPAETDAHMGEWLRSPGLQRPK